MGKNKTWGGHRAGAGRPVAKGRIKGEPTITMTVPLRCKSAIKRLISTQDYQVPVFTEATASAGIPITVPDEHPEMVGLVDYLTYHPEDTFLIRASGDSMIDANIHDGDMLVVDKALEAKDKDVVVASIDNEQTVKRLRHIKGKTYLYPANENYNPRLVSEDTHFQVWGVVKKKVGEVS